MPLHTLREQTTAQLQDQWKELSIRSDPPHFKQALVRGIAWRLQTKVHDNLTLRRAGCSKPRSVTPPIQRHCSEDQTQPKTDPL